MTHEEIAQNLDQITLGLDDTFRFHCTQCGKCCTYRDDILLSPTDIFRMSKKLGMTTEQFFKKYCRSHIGEDSHMPIIRLNSIGKDYRCPLLRNNKCIVHSVKPAVCALFPLGRYLVGANDDSTHNPVIKPDIKYLLQPPDCGDDSETHTVREWLGTFQNSMENQAFIRWQQIFADLGNKVRSMEKKLSPMDLMALWTFMRIHLYLKYDTAKDFMPQLEANYATILEVCGDIRKLKGVVPYAAR